jgi:hypothetical protein
MTLKAQHVGSDPVLTIEEVSGNHITFKELPGFLWESHNFEHVHNYPIPTKDLAGDAGE